MSRNGVVCSTPSFITRILPAFSTTKIRPSLSGCVRKTGLVSPVVTYGFSLSVRAGERVVPPGSVASELWQPARAKASKLEQSKRIGGRFIGALAREMSDGVAIFPAQL